MVTLKPLDWRSFAREAEIIPFPSEELTPPVTNIYLGVLFKLNQFRFQKYKTIHSNINFDDQLYQDLHV